MDARGNCVPIVEGDQGEGYDFPVQPGEETFWKGNGGTLWKQAHTVEAEIQKRRRRNKIARKARKKNRKGK